MERKFYLDLAASGKRIPIATHLVLHEHPDPEKILLDGNRLAGIMEETARRFDHPLALPVMDLTLEKDYLLQAMGIAAGDTALYHFDAPPTDEQTRALERADIFMSGRMKANCDALKILSAKSDIVPVGMSIGPFSLLTKLLHDPIVPIYLAGTGEEPEDSDEVSLLYSLLELCERVILKSCKAQAESGAKAIFVCEPAANLVYFSPNQLDEGSPIFKNFVIEPNLRLKALLDSAGTDLMFHDCGSLTNGMVESFAALDPVLISFGSTVKLVDVEPFVPKTTVIYGNLPTKKFYSDEDVPLSSLPGMVADIETALRKAGHPFIVGSECDVLSIPGYEQSIMKKVKTFCNC